MKPLPIISKLPRPAFLKRKDRVNIVRLKGVIAASGGLGRSALSDESLAPLLEAAFRKGKPCAVAIIINSPGGSPVQSALIGARIRRLAGELDIPVHVYCEDVAASGGYWLACAGDDITVDANTIIGSIGVISAGFGFPELLEKIGVERRVYTAGTQKSMLDPFRPEDPEDIARLKELHGVIHQNFMDHVVARRGEKLAQGEDLFTGRVWTGADAVAVGLADAVGHAVPDLKARYGEKVRFREIARSRGMFQRFGGQTATELMAAVEDRAAWARFGL